jgi:hypothetical protein
VVSQDGSHIVSFTGLVMDSGTGAIEGISKLRSTTQFGPDSRFPLRLNQSVATLDVAGGIRDFSPPCNIGVDGGAQAQWTWVSRNGRYAVIAARDMRNPPQTGLAFYEQLPADPPVGLQSAVVRTAQLGARVRMGWDSRLVVTFATAPTRASIRVIDAAGRTVVHQVLRGTQRTAAFVVGTPLTPGLYVCEVDSRLDGQLNRSTVRIVAQR